MDWMENKEILDCVDKYLEARNKIIHRLRKDLIDLGLPSYVVNAIVEYYEI